MNNHIQKIYAHLFKISAVVLVAVPAIVTSCKKESDAEYLHRTDRLSFKVDKYGADYDLWHEGCATRAANDTVQNSETESLCIPTAIALEGDSTSDTLFIHTLVSNEFVTGADADASAYFSAGAGADSGTGVGAGADSGIYADAMTKGITKSAPVDADSFYDSFGVFASTYTGTWNESSKPYYMRNVAVTKSSGWTTDYLWPKAAGSKIRFFAYAPYNGDGISFSDSNMHGVPTIEYTVPQNVEEQSDILVAETPEIDCNAIAPVSLRFRHALSAVRFVVGDDAVSSTIKSISVKGVYNSGKCKIQSIPVWEHSTTKSDYSLNVNKVITGISGETITAPMQTFMMLPQTLPVGATIEIIYNDGTDHLLRADISKSSWKPGKTYTYKITNSSILWESVLEISGETEVTFRGGDVDFNILSYKEDSKGRRAAVSWVSEFSIDGGATWSKSAPNWLSGFPTVGSGGSIVESYGNIGIAANTEGETSFDDILRNTEPVADNYNLSNSTGGSLIENTANCYIVNAPGRYLLPLVYGNGIKDTEANFDAYAPMTSGTNVLSTFVNHLGNEITSPVIHENENCEPAKAMLIWQDAKDLVTDVTLANDKTALIFNIKRENIRQGNAVVAVYDVEGLAMWSWHIWVTPYIPGIDADRDNAMKDKTVTNRDDVEYTMMPFNIGWCCTNAAIFSPRNVMVRITQKGVASPKSAILKYTQEGGVDINDSESLRDGNCTYYQWGRKDPFMPAIGSETKTWYDNKGYIHTGILTCDFGTDIEACVRDYITSPAIMSSSQMDECYCNLWSAFSNGENADETQIVKTIYDPSPVGYCVPPPAAYSSFSFTGKDSYLLENLNVDGEFDNGFNFYCSKMNPDKTWNLNAGVITFPAVGYRSVDGGKVTYAGTTGLYWTAITRFYRWGSYFLGFDASHVNPREQGPTNMALPVRPVRER